MAGEFKVDTVKRHFTMNRWPITIALHFERMESIADSSLFKIGPQVSKTDQAILKSGILCP